MVRRSRTTLRVAIRWLGRLVMLLLATRFVWLLFAPSPTDPLVQGLLSLTQPFVDPVAAVVPIVWWDRFSGTIIDAQAGFAIVEVWVASYMLQRLATWRPTPAEPLPWLPEPASIGVGRIEPTAGGQPSPSRHGWSGAIRDLIRPVVGLVGLLLVIRVVGLFMGVTSSATIAAPFYVLASVLSAPADLIASGPVAIPYSTSFLDPAGLIALTSYGFLGWLAFELLSRPGPPEPLPPLPMLTGVSFRPVHARDDAEEVGSVATAHVVGAIRRGRRD